MSMCRNIFKSKENFNFIQGFIIKHYSIFVSPEFEFTFNKYRVIDDFLIIFNSGSCWVIFFYMLFNFNGYSLFGNSYFLCGCSQIKKRRE